MLKNKAYIEDEEFLQKMQLFGFRSRGSTANNTFLDIVDEMAILM